MRAWRVGTLGEPADVLLVEDVDPPEAEEGCVVVEVDAVALNFADVLMCRGGYQEAPDLPFTPGLELAGTVVGGARAGERVVGVPQLPHGAMAERAVLRAEAALAVPDEMRPQDAAAMHVAYQTGHVALTRRAALQRGETLLVHAAAGGVGAAAIRLGKAAGARVIASAGGSSKTDLCRELGADVVVDHRREDFVEVVREQTDGRGADVIYDPVGGETFERSRRCVAFEGRIVVIGFASGEIPRLATNHALMKNYSVVGVHWNTYRHEHPHVVAEAHRAIIDLWRRGEARPTIGERGNLEDVPASLTRLGGGSTIGKTVLTWGGR